jgi:hypothetical protein
VLESAAKGDSAMKRAVDSLEKQLETVKNENENLKISLETKKMNARGVSGVGSSVGVVGSNDLSLMNNSTQAMSDEISRLNFELSLVQKDKEKALALIVDLVGKKRLMKYLDAHGKDQNALKTLKKMVRRGMMSSPSKSPEHNQKLGAQQQSPAVVPRADHGAWWSTRDLNQVPSARGSSRQSSSPEKMMTPGNDGNRGRSGGRSGGRSTQHRSHRSPNSDAQYDELLQMARDQQSTMNSSHASNNKGRRAPFVSTGRRHSTFQGMSQSKNGRVQSGRAHLLQVEREYENAASGSYQERW